MGRIDAHHHLWDLQAVEYPWLTATGTPRFFGDPAPIQRDFSLREFRGLAEPHGFTGSVHIQVGARDSLAEARFINAVASANPDWPLVQVAAASLEQEDREAQLDRLLELPSLRGIRQIIGRAPQEDAELGTHALLDDPAFKQGLALLAAKKLSFDLQLIPKVMARTAALLAGLPDLNVALCHAGSPHDRTPSGLADWTAQLEELSQLEHVHVKLSGLGMFEHDWSEASLAPIIREVWRQFGEDRVMFGSNFPVDSLSSSYEALIRLYESQIPRAAHDKVFGRNAQRFYRF